ncbi:MAG: AAA family ATPase [Myxococcales bacterium]|nr:AAA family ATPase [Myxococcales bacterium]
MGAVVTSPQRLGFCQSCERDADERCLREEHPVLEPGGDGTSGHRTTTTSAIPFGGSLGRGAAESPAEELVPLLAAARLKTRRYRTRLGALDRVLGVDEDGAGLVSDSAALFYGEPGIGKSTLLMELAVRLATFDGLTVLYVSGEEVEGQIGSRAERMGLRHPKVLLLNTSRWRVIDQRLRELRGTPLDPDVVILDSAQAIVEDREEVRGLRKGQPMVPGAAGSVAQVRYLGQRAVGLSKGEKRAVIIVGQVTKDGEAAGPKTLEHAVDATFMFSRDEADRRVVRATKNRFGAVGECATFDMTSRGLSSVVESATQTLREMRGSVGVAATAVAEGFPRPVLCAIEASATRVYEGTARAPIAMGFPSSRLSFLLEKMAEELDVDTTRYAIRVQMPTLAGSPVPEGERGTDLAICAAVLSAMARLPTPDALVFGEVGLSGAVKSVSRGEQRAEIAAEARDCRFNHFVMPGATAPAFPRAMTPTIGRIHQLGELMDFLWPMGLGDAHRIARNGDVDDEESPRMKGKGRKKKAETHEGEAPPEDETGSLGADGKPPWEE